MSWTVIIMDPGDPKVKVDWFYLKQLALSPQHSFASIRAALLNLRVRLGSTYFVKTENFLLKTL